MSNDDDVLRQQGPGSGLSRRDALRKLGLFGAAAVVAPAVLAACGGDDDDDAGGGGGGATTTAAGGGGAGGDVGTQLAEMLGIDAAGKNGKGVAFALGNVLALTGNGSFYGQTMTRGTDLAVKHVAAAGGPNITVSYKDHKSGDPAGRRHRDQRARAPRRCRPSWPPTSTTSARCSPGPSSSRSSRSMVAAAPASSGRAFPTSGAPGPSRRTTPCPGCSCTSRRSSPTRRRSG